jgi:acylphosphatase
MTNETAPEGINAIRVFVHGRVQGVGYRNFVQGEARRLILTGFARNLSDGISVEVVAEGSRSALETLIAALRRGPPLADVRNIEVGWQAATGGYKGFVAY